MWERYCRDVGTIVFIVDIADKPLIPKARQELHELMKEPSLEGIPLLVLGNKCDLTERLTVDQLIEELDLRNIDGHEVCCYGISALLETNLEAVVQYLTHQAKMAAKNA